MSKAAFKYYWDNPDIEWTCSLCALPMRTGQYLFDSSPTGRAAPVENNIATPSTQCCLHSDDEDELGEDYLTNFAKEPSTASKDLRVAHLNIRSVRNKIDEL